MALFEINRSPIPYRLYLLANLTEWTAMQMNPKLNAGAHRVFGALVSKMGRMNYVNLTYRELGEMTDMDVSHIRRALSILKDEGYVKQLSQPNRNMRLMINPQILWRYSWRDYQKGLAIFKGADCLNTLSTTKKSVSLEKPDKAVIEQCD